MEILVLKHAGTGLVCYRETLQKRRTCLPRKLGK